MERKLSAILATDVVGYSRLMGEDEAGTLTALKSHRAELIDPKATQYNGRTIKLMGDGALMEFDSVVDAVAFAVEVQNAMRDRNKDVSDERQIVYRIGINIGDVIVDGDDIYGDGVNVAARLEGLAEAGGICVARNVHDQVRDKLDLNFQDLGEVSVKNIARPVRAFQIVMDKKAAALSTPIVQGAARRMPSTRTFVAAAIALILLAVGAGLWMRSNSLDFTPAVAANMAFPLPDKPSIAVLPFEALSDDKKLGYFTTGLTEGLTGALARVPGLFVISNQSVATYKGKPVRLKQAAEEQGVQYLLKGSVQKSDDKLRINARLVDALIGRNVWTGSFDRPDGDVFAVQDEIVKRVSVELQVKLAEGGHARSASRGTNSLKAWLLSVQGKAQFTTFTRDGMIKARELDEAAQHADPNWSRPVASLALVDWYEARRGWSASRKDAIRSGMALAERAIQMDPNDPLGYQALGNLLFLIGQPKRGIEVRRKAIKIAPNDSLVVAGLAARLVLWGGEQEAVELIERAIRLSPKHPWWVSTIYGHALHLVGRKEEAVAALKRAIDQKPRSVSPQVRLAAVYADLGRMNEAKAAATEVKLRKPKFTASRYMKSYSLNDPKRDAWFKALLLRAGLPE
jgi:adenylate cyclase